MPVFGDAATAGGKPSQEGSRRWDWQRPPLSHPPYWLLVVCWSPLLHSHARPMQKHPITLSFILIYCCTNSLCCGLQQPLNVLLMSNVQCMMIQNEASVCKLTPTQNVITLRQQKFVISLGTHVMSKLWPNVSLVKNDPLYQIKF